MNIYLNKNKMITTMTKRKTIAPTAPITASTLGSAISDFNSTKKNCFTFKNSNKSEESDERRTILVARTKTPKRLYYVSTVVLSIIIQR